MSLKPLNIFQKNSRNYLFVLNVSFNKVPNLKLTKKKKTAEVNVNALAINKNV